MKHSIGDVKELNVRSEQVCSFYGQHWKRKIALSRDSFYKWQFTGSPSDAGDDHCMIAIASETHEILGVMGLNRRVFLLDGEPMNAAELTSWIVDENQVGKGIGAGILEAIQAKYDVLVGMGISEMALPIYMHHGFRYIAAIPRFIKVLNFEAIVPYAQYSSWVPKLTTYWASRGDGVPFHVDAVTEETLREIDAEAQRTFHYFSRDLPDLQWRYLHHPLFHYKPFIVSSKSRGEGVLVCLREETSVLPLRMLHVLDVFGDERDIPAALSFIHRYGVERDFHVVDFYCTSTRVTRHLIGAGWFSVNDDTCFQFPHLFHPLELRIPPTTSLIYWSRTRFSELADLSKLYITKQDCDLDRPTLETYDRLGDAPEGKERPQGRQETRAPMREIADDHR
jgi:hypothetical protein